MIEESQSLHHRILLENVPSCGDKLQQVLEAMKENRMISLAYLRYGADCESAYTLAPYCVKLFHQRWYLLAKSQKEQMRVFAIDRILQIEILSEKFKMEEGLLDLPIHRSQQTIKKTEEYIDIEVHLCPTDDFIAHILSRGPWLQVMSPQWLVADVKGWISDTLRRYENTEK